VFSFTKVKESARTRISINIFSLKKGLQRIATIH